MARLFSDQLSAATGLVRPDTSLLPAAASRGLLLGGIGIGAAAGVLITLLLMRPVAIDPGLVRLLHGMVAIKGLILAAAAALVLRRLRGPVHGRCLLGYAAGLALSAGALPWLWGLSALLPGSILFYGGLIVTFISASRDPLLLQGLRARAAGPGSV
jgi:hypothetical protein